MQITIKILVKAVVHSSTHSEIRCFGSSLQDMAANTFKNFADLDSKIWISDGILGPQWNSWMLCLLFHNTGTQLLNMVLLNSTTFCISMFKYTAAWNLECRCNEYCSNMKTHDVTSRMRPPESVKAMQHFIIFRMLKIILNYGVV